VVHLYGTIIVGTGVGVASVTVIDFSSVSSSPLTAILKEQNSWQFG
jgi:hypothetical protein